MGWSGGKLVPGGWAIGVIIGSERGGGIINEASHFEGVQRECNGAALAVQHSMA